MFKSRSAAFSVWAIASIFYAYQYILRVVPSAMLEDITKQFGFDAAEYGQFSGVYYIGYSLMHIPMGVMLDRIGPRKVMTACILLTVIGTLPILLSDYWLYPIIGRALIGIGSSAAILGTFKVIRIAFSEKKFASMLGWSVTIGILGAIYGGGPISYMSDQMGYKAVIQIICIIGLVLAALTYFIVPEIEAKIDTSIASDVKEVLTNFRVLAICMLGGLMVGPLEGFADVWGMIYLKKVYGIEDTIAASLPSLIFIGMSIGAPFIGYVAEKTGCYIGTVAVTAVIMAISFVLILTGGLSANMISIIFVLIGLCCAYQILVIFKATTYGREHVAGLTTASANMIIMLFGYFFHSMIGSTIDLMGGKNSATALSYGIATIPVAMILAFGGLLLLRYSDTKRAKKKELEITTVAN